MWCSPGVWEVAAGETLDPGRLVHEVKVGGGAQAELGIGVRIPLWHVGRRGKLSGVPC
jgi:hypothetical protein